MSATATIEAGILGPALEAQLNARGFTLGHFPQSFQFSSLGGWIATRSGGQKSTLYGKIEERVQSLRLAFPGGDLATRDVPAAAAGPDLNQLIVGSEGILGVITQATMRLAPSPQRLEFRGVPVPGLPRRRRGGPRDDAARADAFRPPPLRRTGDGHQPRLSLHASRPGRRHREGGRLVPEPPRRQPGPRFRPHPRLRGRRGGRALAVAGARSPSSAAGAASPSAESPGRAWERSRYEAPYLRDVLLDHAILVDTLETATTWDRYLALYAAVRDAIAGALGERSLVMAHLSHSYPHGGSIYFTFIARQEQGREIEQWERAKKAATQTIIDNGAAL